MGRDRSGDGQRFDSHDDTSRWVGADPGHVDLELRRALSEAYPDSFEARSAFDELRPGLAAIRRRQLVRQGALAAAAIALFLLGGQALLARLDSSGESTVVAGPVDGGAVTPDSAASPEQDVPPGLPVATPPASDPDGQEPLVDQTASAPVTEDTEPSSPPAGDPQQSDPTASSEPPASESTTPPFTTEATSETTTTAQAPIAPSTTVHQSMCGSVAYTVDGRRISLVEAIPIGGGEVDVKSSGPDKIEVSFEGGGEHCEITIEWRDGRFQASEQESE